MDLSTVVYLVSVALQGAWALYVMLREGCIGLHSGIVRHSSIREDLFLSDVAGGSRADHASKRVNVAVEKGYQFSQVLSTERERRLKDCVRVWGYGVLRLLWHFFTLGYASRLA